MQHASFSPALQEKKEAEKAAAGRGRGKGRGRGELPAALTATAERGRGRGRGGLPAGIPPLTARPQLTPRAQVGAGARDTSPASSESSREANDAAKKGGRTKLFCMDCYSPDKNRLMNFHPQCWNEWHCGGCDEEGEETADS